MRKLTTKLTIVLAIGTLIILSPWLITFPWSLSHRAEDWSSFGGYFGGLMSPFVAALALVALIDTIRQQQHQISLTKTQSNKSDVLKIIEKLENDYISILKGFPIELTIGKEVCHYTAFDCLDKLTFPEWDSIIVSTKDIDRSESYSYNDDRLLRLEVFGKAGGYLNQLRKYVDIFDELAKSNALSQYYQWKYKHHLERYNEKGMIIEKWEPM